MGVRRRDQYYYQIKDLLSFRRNTSLLSQIVLSSTIHRPGQRLHIWKNLLQQILVKRGGWLWVISPLPYRGRTAMVIGIDTCVLSKDTPTIQAMCSTTNPYFTSCYSTWRRTAYATKGVCSPPPGELLRETVLHFFAENHRLPDTVVVYRGGVSESQEVGLLESELYNPEGGLLQAFVAVSEEVDLDEDALNSWRERFELAYIIVRRSTSTRLRSEAGENLPSGTYVDDEIVVRREETDQTEPKRFDFYMVSQSFVIGTAKPTLYSVLYNTTTMSRFDIIQLTYRLCALYQTFSGMVSMPAPLKCASKLVSLLSKCESVPPEPAPSHRKLKPWLFYV